MSIVIESVVFTDSIDGSATHQRSPVRVATTTLGVLVNGFENGDVVDGVTLVTGDDILIKDQGSSENGIYTIQATGAPVRRSDLEVGDSANGATVFVKEGTVNGGSIFTCLSDPGTDVVDTDTLNFSQSSINGIVSVEQGGTGVSSLTSGNVLVGGGTGPVTATKAAPTGDFVGTTDVQTLSNKTLTAPVVDGDLVFNEATNDLTIAVTDQATGAATATIPDLGGVSQDIVLTSQSQTLSNKTLNSPVISGDTVHNLATNDLTIAVTDQATGTATVTIPDLGGVSQDYVFTEATQTLTNKTLVEPSITDNSLSITAQTGTDRELILDPTGGTDSTTTTLITSQTANRTLTLPDISGTLATIEDIQSTASGLDWKESVKLASTDALNDNGSITGSITYNNTGGTSGRGQITATLTVSDTFTLDGVTLSSADNGTRLLLKNEANTVTSPNGARNGIWTVSISGTSLVLDRAEDADEDSEVTANIAMFVSEGTVNSDSAWTLTNNDPVIIGGASGTVLNFTQFNGLGNVTAGNGLTKTGNTLDVDLKANGGLVIESSQVAVNLSATNITGTLSVGDGGTGATTLTSGNVLVGDGTNAVTTTKAAPTGDFVGTTDAQTITNKTLTAPIIDQINDANNNEMVVFNTVASAVDHLQISNAATGGSPTLEVVGDSANVDLSFQSKGTGVYNFNNATNPAEIRLFDADASDYVGLDAAATTTSYTLTLPPSVGTTGQVLRLADNAGNLEFAAGSSVSTFTINFPFEVVVNKSNYTTIGYFAWRNADYSSFNNGRMIFEVDGIVNRTLDIRIRNITAGNDVVEVTGINANAFRNDGSFTNPIADARLAIQVRKNSPGGTDPLIFGLHVTWDE